MTGKEEPSPGSWIAAAQLAGGTGTFRLDVGSGCWEWTPQIAILFGFDPNQATQRFADWESVVFPDDVPKIKAAVEAARSGSDYAVEFRVRHPDGSIRWLAGRGRVDAAGSCGSPALIGSYSDIDYRKTLEARLLGLNETLEARVGELREEARTLEILNRTGVALASELDLDRLVQKVTDAGVELTEAESGGFFYNVLDGNGEASTLCALSDAARTAFAGIPMPRVTTVSEPTFRGLGTVRSDDIRADRRYGQMLPYFGIPADNVPVRSYLAVPVTSRSGEVLGGLFFCHSDPGKFSERSERILAGVAAQAAVAIDNAHLYQQGRREIERRSRTEEELQRLNETLEERVRHRARQLEASFAQLRDSERRFRLLVEAVTDYAIFMLDPDGNVVNWNSGAERIKGYRAEEIIGQHFSRFYTEADREKRLPEEVLRRAAASGKHQIEGWRVRKDGSVFWASIVVEAIRDRAGTLLGFAKVTRDMTEKLAAEERLRQAQKMEAVGQLTGGIAHDFNNLLTVISGQIDTLLRRLPGGGGGDELRRPANAALRAAERAAVLTHRLLSFARRQPLEPTSVSANTMITGMSEMLRRTLGESIMIETVLGGGLWPTLVDANHLEGALLNLAINARDAMPDGGRLTIEAANVYLDEAYAKTADIVAGQYVGIFVSDTGVGMTQETIANAFDPFFTTKELGQGTGLGLSQVYGFVKQSGGHIKLYSEAGAGTTVKLYLPRDYSAGESADGPPAADPVPRGAGETILLTEDDPDVRSFTAEMLRELGYHVIEAMNGHAALRLLDANPETAMLFTDIGLPGGMNGRQLADEARRRRSRLKVLFTSGYARNAVVHHGRLDPGVELLAKPFTFAALAARLRRILDE